MLKLFFTKIKILIVKADLNQMEFSTEYFIPLKNITYGIPLKCDNNSNITDGEIIVYQPKVRSS